MHHPFVVEVDDLGDGDGIVMPGDDVGAGADAGRISSLVGEGPGSPVSSWVFQST